MAIDTALVTFDLHDYLGDNFDARRTKVWLTTNVPEDAIADTATGEVRIGGGSVTLADSGATEALVPIPGADTNPPTWQTTVHVDYVDKGTRERKRKSFGPYTITESSTLGGLIEEQVAVPTATAADYAAQAEAAVDSIGDAATVATTAAAQAEVERVAAEAAAAQARDISGIETTDDAVDAALKLPGGKAASTLSASIDGRSGTYRIVAPTDGTDAVPSIAAGLAAAAAFGAKPLLPEGEYSIASTLTIPEGANLSGAGEATTLKLSADPGAYIVQLPNSRSSITDLRVEDNGYAAIPVHVGTSGSATLIEDVTVARLSVLCTAAGNAGIWSTSANRVRIHDNTVVNLAATATDVLAKGIALHGDTTGSGETFDHWVTRNRVKGFYRGIESYGTASRLGVSIVDNHVTDCADTGIYAYHAPRSLISGNDVADCAVGGIWSDSGSDSETPSESAPGNRVVSNRVTRCGSGTDGYGILTEEVVNGVVANNSVTDGGADGIRLGGGTMNTAVTGNTVSGNALDGIVLDKARNPNNYFLAEIAITGNVVRLNGRHGIRLLGVQRSTLVGNNIVTDNGTSAPSTFAGLLIDKDASPCQTVHVVGNVFGNALPSGAGTGSSGQQVYGVRVNQNVAAIDVTVTGNYFRGCTTANVYARSTAITIFGNYSFDGILDGGGATTARYGGNMGSDYAGVTAAGVATVTHASGTLTIRPSDTTIVTLNGNVSTLNISDAKPGMKVTLVLLQDATGGRTVGWHSSFKFAGGSAPSAPAAGTRNILTFVYDGTNWLECSRSVAV